MFIDSFDHNANAGIPNRQGKAHDAAVLNASTKVSIFWVTETQARSERVGSWEDQGKLELDNSCGYPWFIVKVKGELD